VGRTASRRHWHKGYQCTFVFIVGHYYDDLHVFIPRIVWPLEGDQPGNAAHLTLSLDVAFELVEVRGAKPLYRGVQPAGTIEAVAAEARNILKQARGPEGEQKRRNAESMRHKWKKEWEESGEALSNLKRFLTDISHND
jgi:hypothetical protein